MTQRLFWLVCSATINDCHDTRMYTQHETLEALLERGEKLDDLVSRTDKLSTTSKAFYNEVQ